MKPLSETLTIHNLGRCMTDSERWNLHLAESAALKSTVRKARVGAAVVGRRAGWLYSRPNEYIQDAGPQGPFSLHAEIATLTELLGEEIDDELTLYVVRVLRNGKFALAKPCDSCRNKLLRAGIDRVVYTISDKEVEIMECPYD